MKVNFVSIAIVIGFVALTNVPAYAAEYGLRDDNVDCIHDVRRIPKGKGWFAIAVTRSIGNAQGCGIVAGVTTAKEARRVAIKACEVNRKYEIFENRTGCRVTGIKGISESVAKGPHPPFGHLLPFAKAQTGEGDTS